MAYDWDIIAKNTKLKDSSIQSLVKTLPEIEKEIFARVRKYMEGLPIKGGKFSKTTKKGAVNNIAKMVRETIKESNYVGEVNEYLNNFEEIAENTRIFHEGGGGKGIKDLVNQTRKDMVLIVQEDLLAANVDLQFINPVKKALYKSINFGGSLTDTRDIIRDMVTGKQGKHGALTRWAGQVAKDSVYQYDGQIHQKIAKKLDYKKIRYVNRLTKKSRGQCAKWRGIKTILLEDLEKEIAWAFSQQGGRKKYKGRRVSGMISDTTVENFIINRGGYGCVHEAIPIK